MSLRQSRCHWITARTNRQQPNTRSYSASQPSAWGMADMPPWATAQLSLKHAQLLFLFQTLCALFLGRGLDRLRLFGTRARINVTGLNVDVRLFSRSEEHTSEL